MKHFLISARHTACLVALVWLSQPSLSQNTPQVSQEKRASLIARRDAVAEQAIAMANQGEYDEAQKLFDQVFELEKTIFGPTHVELLGTLNRQAQVATFAKHSKAAIEYRGRAYEIGKRLYAPGGYQVRDLELALEEARNNAQRTDEQQHLVSQLTAASRHVLALSRQGKYPEASDLAERVVNVRRNVLGKEHPAYAESLNQMALLYNSMGDYARAEPLFVEAKAIRANVLGEQHPEYAVSLNNLALLYQLIGDHARAEPLYIQAKSIRKKVLGEEHPSYAITLNNLAGLYQSMGDYARAEPLFIETKAIQEKVLGKEHPEYASTLSNLAALYKPMGDYARAEPLLVESKAILEKVIGKAHPDYAITLNNLAALYSAMGDYERAKTLYSEAKTTLGNALGKEHPFYANSLNNLAGLYRLLGDDAKAESLSAEAGKILENKFGKEHPAYANFLVGRANFHQRMGDYTRAEPLYVEAKAIQEKVLGKEHPEYATSLTNLAALYHATGEYARSERLYLEGLKLQQRMLGKEHPDYASSLINLACLYESMDDYARAERLFIEATDITLNHLQATAYVQSEQQQLLMSQSVRYRLDHYLRCCLQGGLDAQYFVERVVLWKGDILRRARDLRLAATDPAIEERFRDLQSIASQLAAAIRSGPELDKIDAWKKRLADLTEQRRRLEVDLSRRSAAFRSAVQTVSFAQIRQSIPADGVLIDYSECETIRGRVLVASVIRREGEVTLLDLGSAELAGKAIDTWKESFGMTAEARAGGIELRKQLWEPLLGYLRDAELILVSTDGVLGRLPLAALPGQKPNSYLIEDHRIALIPVPQLLPALASKQELRTSDYEALLVGDVDYGKSDAEEGWLSLAETGKEIDFIKELVARTVQANDETFRELRAEAATESAFRELAPKAQLLHLATHGFFAPADKENALSASAIAQSRGSATKPMSISGEDRNRVLGYSPGQLSGLVFAGANVASASIKRFSTGKPVDDGIMTADEIAYLPLERTELAVLSACETGLGEIAGGEGLIGIQRAFQVAGADSVVATMWKVDDRMTRKLMERFYHHYFANRKSKLDALREAQLSVLRDPSLVEPSRDRGPPRELRKARNASDTQSRPRTNPYYWAPFVLSGDWR